ncbi:MAG: CDGSH iron-sulfur domain-containing protein [Motilibacteraceae bacterium]
MAAQGQDEPEAPPVTVKVFPGGPYLLIGDVLISSPDGSVSRRLSKVALCRCGHSATKPFCDGSHTRAGFSGEGMSDGS